jgi:hypothetical protein
MTRATLSERLRTYDRLWCRLGLTVGPALLLLALAGPPLLPLVVEWRFEQPEGPEKWLAVILPLAIVGVTTLLLGLVLWCQRWTARTFGLLCPSCGVPLTGKHRAATLSSGCCGRCHARIVEDAWPPGSNADPGAVPERPRE